MIKDFLGNSFRFFVLLLQQNRSINDKMFFLIDKFHFNLINNNKKKLNTKSDKKFNIQYIFRKDFCINNIVERELLIQFNCFKLVISS